MSFEDLEVWKNGMRLAVEVYQEFGKDRDFGFRDQICRSAVSVPSNIAEGYERGSNKEFIRFMRIALGSAAELRTQLYLAARLEKLPAGRVAQLIEQAKTVSGQLSRLIQYRQRSVEE